MDFILIFLYIYYLVAFLVCVSGFFWVFFFFVVVVLVLRKHVFKYLGVKCQ